MGLGIHSAAMIFPEMSDVEWNSLCVDIRDNGLREPIVVYNGQVIDGRNRLRACRWLGVEPKFREYEGEEAGLIPYVLSLNLHRRHLSESQRAMVAAKLETMKPGRPTKDANLHVSRDAAASMLSVSERSVASAKRIATKAEPEVTRAVEAGRMTLNEASKVVQLRPEMQRAVADLPKAERRESIKGNTLEELEVHKAASDEFGEERVGLEMALEELCKVNGSPEQLILDCPKYAAPSLNRYFRQAFMRMQALNAVYQNWEFRNVHND